MVTITATDLAGSSDTATVRVFLAFELSDSPSLTLTLGDAAHRFSVSGGVAPYTWLVNEAELATAVAYYDFDPTTAGTHILAVHDDIGNYRETTITVVASSGVPLVIDPAEATVLQIRHVNFTAYGGDGPSTYVWSSSAGALSITGPRPAQLTAPDSVEELTVTLSSSGT